MAGTLSCIRCRAQVAAPVNVGAADLQCAACGTVQEILTFPALLRPISPGRAAEQSVLEGEGTCFFHPAKKAVVPCDGCGRFLCALCDLDLDGRHYCSGCLAQARKGGQLDHLATRRFVPAGAALTLAIVPILFWPVTAVTAPAAVYFAIQSFRRPGSVVGGGTASALVAMILGFGQIAAWGVGLFALLHATP